MNAYSEWTSPQSLNKVSVRGNSSFFYRWYLGAGSLVAAYTAAYTYIYDNYLSVVYGYMGFRNDSIATDEFVLALACIFLALTFLPKILREASDFFGWFTYVLAFIPAQITVSKTGAIPGGSIPLSISLLVSLILIVNIPRALTLRRIGLHGLKGVSTPRAVVVLTSITAMVLVAKYLPIMNFASIEEIYDQRAAAAAYGGGRVFGYLLNWQVSAFSALLLAYSLTSGKYNLAILAVISLLIVYMITGAKITFAILGLVLGVRFLLGLDLTRKPYLLVGIPLVVVVSIAALLQAKGVYLSDLSLFIVSQLLMRAIGIQAMLMSAYAEFFSVEPFTYYSHVSGISSIVDYPFSDSLGVVIGVFLSGNPAFNANAGFWVTDGIAAAGTLGVVVIGVLVGIIFSALNALSRGADPRFIYLAMIPFCMAAVVSFPSR